eukprot:Trichotokara_eunicae@DN7388_c0_g1_i1.p1
MGYGSQNIRHGATAANVNYAQYSNQQNAPGPPNTVKESRKKTTRKFQSSSSNITTQTAEEGECSWTDGVVDFCEQYVWQQQKKKKKKKKKYSALI